MIDAIEIATANVEPLSITSSKKVSATATTTYTNGKAIWLPKQLQSIGLYVLPVRRGHHNLAGILLQSVTVSVCPAFGLAAALLFPVVNQCRIC